MVHFSISNIEIIYVKRSKVRVTIKTKCLAHCRKSFCRFMVGVLMGKGNGMDFYYKRKRNVHRWVGFWDFGREEVLRTWGFFQWPQDADAYRKVFRALMRHETKRQSDRQAASTQTDPQIQLHSQIRIHRYRCSECSVRLCEEIQRCLLAFITFAWSGVDAAGGDGDDEEDGDRDET